MAKQIFKTNVPNNAANCPMAKQQGFPNKRKYTAAWPKQKANKQKNANRTAASAKTDANKIQTAKWQAA